MKKRGQFYLIAAMIIVIVLAGFITISNYVQKQRTDDMLDLEKELKFEVEKTLDYLAHADLDSAGAETVIENLTNIYIEKIGNKTSIFLFGRQSSKLIVKGNNAQDQIIYIDIGSDFEILTNEDGEFSRELYPSLNNIKIKLQENEYLFELEQGQNLYFLISKEDGGEMQIIRG